MRVCTIEGCGGKHKAIGYCLKHYRRFQRHGDVNHVSLEVGFNNKSHQLYTTWCGMKERCNNPNNKSYKYYGGRGIKVCDRWLNSFQCFLSDMGEKPTQNHTLDRIDNNGDYIADNCQWITMQEQVEKQGLRSTNKTGYKGIHIHNDGYQVAHKGEYIGYSKTLLGAVKILEEYRGGK